MEVSCELWPSGPREISLSMKSQSSKEFGRILTLDVELINTEKDEFFYSEMMVHVPLAVQPMIRNVLVIGGCDGGVLRELEKYESIATIDVVELDEKVIQDIFKWIFVFIKSQI